ncbi:MAG: YihA family ribosome biogenesis GTP-binding protein [Lachnospiraceae bacterium]|nr:YihA family ribosome biogenesis GTP-binding protein [Lachnospiraceae bacterium]
MVIRSVVLDCVCGITSRLPAHEAPEFAFAGRSNVGKSSLVNALLNRKAFARVSQEPGKTRTINYYLVNEAFYLTDLPGYGYARVSAETRAKWGAMIDRYFRTSGSLKAVFLLLDMRHEPSAEDLKMYARIVEYGFRPAVILTKADKLSANEQAKMKAVIRRVLGMPQDGILIPFSSVKKTGREEVLQLMESFLGEARESGDPEAFCGPQG